MEDRTKFPSKCPKPLSLDVLRNEIYPKVMGILDNPQKSNKLPIHEQDDMIIGLDIFNHVWTMCTKDVLMIDFDVKEGFTKQAAIDLVREYTNFLHEHGGVDMLFKMYETDRGIHAFLVNRRMEHTSDEAVEMMMDLCNDA